MKRLLILTTLAALAVGAVGCQRFNWFRRGDPCTPVYSNPCYNPCDPCAAPATVTPGPETYTPSPAN